MMIRRSADLFGELQLHEYYFSKLSYSSKYLETIETHLTDPWIGDKVVCRVQSSPALTYQS